MDMHHSCPGGMINVPGVAPAPLDTTGLENSFENLGRDNGRCPRYATTN